MRIALHQCPSPAGATGSALAMLDTSLAAARAAGAGALVLPELFLPGYNVPDPGAGARTAAGWDTELAPRARAAGVALVTGLAERDGTRLFNSAMAWGPDGARLALYRKVQLFGPREKALFTPGDRLVSFRLGPRKAALLICYDIEFAPHCATLAAAGVDLVLVPTANMLPFTHVGRLTVPTQAVNHALAIVYANYCGAEGDLTYAGGSVIAGPDGTVLAQAGPGPALLVADLDHPADPALLSTQAADVRPAPL